MNLTLSRLKSCLSYDPSTGIFCRRQSPRPSMVGRKVGFVHSQGYLCTEIDGQRYFLHRLAWFYMTGRWPKYTIDHINGVRSDNRWANLRDVDQQHNSANMKRRPSNKSGYKGVVQAPHGRTYRAYIHIDRKTKYLGSYPCPRQAHAAYCEAAMHAWGDSHRAQ